MGKGIDYLVEKFQQPLSPLFFLLGAVLILLGITRGLDIPILKSVVTSENYRVVSIALGVVCLVTSVIVYRFGQEDPSRQVGRSTNSIGKTNSEISCEMELPVLVRLTQISDSQRRILRFVEAKREINMAGLMREFSNMKEAELYYRMEQLRLLGFVTRQRLGDGELDPSALIFRLSDEYRRAIEEVPFATAVSSSPPHRPR